MVLGKLFMSGRPGGAMVLGKLPVPGRPTSLAGAYCACSRCGWGFVGWLVVFGLNDPLRQYFSLYRVVSQREGERKEKG